MNSLNPVRTTKLNTAFITLSAVQAVLFAVITALVIYETYCGITLAYFLEQAESTGYLVLIVIFAPFYAILVLGSLIFKCLFSVCAFIYFLLFALSAKKFMFCPPKMRRLYTGSIALNAFIIPALVFFLLIYKDCFMQPESPIFALELTKCVFLSVSSAIAVAAIAISATAVKSIKQRLIPPPVPRPPFDDPFDL